MLLGLWLYLGDQNAPWSSVAAGVVMGLALFIKHNIVALPIAFVWWLFIYDRRASFRLPQPASLQVLWFGPVLCGVRSGFFHRPSRASQLQPGRRLPLWFVLPRADGSSTLIFALGAIILRDRYSRLFLLFACVALPIGLIERTGEGVAIN